MTIAVGDELPDAIFLEKAEGGMSRVSLAEFLAGRRVVLFGLPGAYTGTCATLHVPSFIRVADQLRARGIAEIACVSVNDPHVLLAWSEATGAGKAGIRMLADADGAFTQAIGLAFDNPGGGLYGRSKRYAMIVDNGVVTLLNLEPSPGQCDISAGENILDAA